MHGSASASQVHVLICIFDDTTQTEIAQLDLEGVAVDLRKSNEKNK
jgi:hypothetical protein